jgi:hypothetical protein
MTKAGERLLEGAREALAIAKGEQPAASVTIGGHTYVPKNVAFEDAARMLYAWAKRAIIVDECRDHRVPGCLSCDTIAFFECVADELKSDEFRKP